VADRAAPHLGPRAGRQALTTTVEAYLLLASARVRSDWQYRTSFAVFLFASLVINVFDFVGIAVLFTKTETLGDWSLDQVAFLYGAAGLCFGIGDLLVGSVENLSTKIKDGSFDVLLTRPVNALVNLTASEFTLRRLGKIGQAAAIFAIALAVNDIDWTPGRGVAVIVMLGAGSVIASATWVITASIAFWLINTREIGNAFTYGGGLAISYPVHVFEQWLRVLLTFIFPLVFVSYLPALYILGIDSPLALPDFLRWSSPVVAGAMVLVATRVWRRGLRRYRSTGS